MSETLQHAEQMLVKQIDADITEAKQYIRELRALRRKFVARLKAYTAEQ